MRILVVSSYLPWPLQSGGNVAQFSTFGCFGSDHEFTLVCPLVTPAQLVHAEELAAQLPNVRVKGVYCGSPLKKSGRGAPPPELSLLRRILRRAAREMSERFDRPKYAASNLPFNPFYRMPHQMIGALGEEFARGTDLCQVEFADMLPLAGWLPAQVPKLFINHQIQFVYARRYAQTYGLGELGNYLAKAMRVQEIACLQLFDGVVTFSDEDKRALLPWLPSDKVFTSPFPVPADVGIAREIAENFDGRFLFVASENHDPNRDALQWLVSEIWPQIAKKLPSARLVVVGDWSQTARREFEGPNISFPGFVKDLAAELRGGIMLVPLRIGSGIRVKILAAAAQGVPVVTTPVGVEGLLLRDGHEALVRADAATFAEAAVQLAQNPPLWRHLAVAGRDAVVKSYSAPEVRKRRNEIYATLIQNKLSR